MSDVNKLSDAEEERLAILGEECAEIVQLVGKIIRHGYESFHPANPELTNRMLLAKEIGHFLANLDLMTSRSDVDKHLIETSSDLKKLTRSKYTHYQNYSAEDFPKIYAL